MDSVGDESIGAREYDFKKYLRAPPPDLSMASA
jgi:hypothetical protein